MPRFFRALFWIVPFSLLISCGGGGGDSTTTPGGGGTPNPPPPVTQAGYVVVAWSELGMHCMDGKDYSIAAILPPYNTVHAQLISRQNLRR